MPSRSTKMLLKLPSVSRPSGSTNTVSYLPPSRRAASMKARAVDLILRRISSVSTGSGRTATSTGWVGVSGIGFNSIAIDPLGDSNSRSIAGSTRRKVAACNSLRAEWRLNGKSNRTADASSRSRCRSSSAIPTSGSNRIVSIKSNALPSEATNFPLSKHSAHSSSSTLSTTSPDPSPNRAMLEFSSISSVRMSTLNAASPFGSIHPIDPV